MKKKIEKPENFNFEAFQAEVEVASPGRINLIGEHTDYNNGFVMPTAIDKKIYLKLSAAKGRTCRIYSKTFDSYFEFELDDFSKSDNSWENYILGVVDEIQKKGKTLKPFDAVLKSELPIGAGISSSAALECGLAAGLNQLFNLGLSKEAIVKLSQAAENNFVGNNCGIMDQYACVMSKENHFIKLDCKSLEAEFIPANFKNCKILLLNTNVSHSLTNSEYNTRRQECEQAVKIIQNQYPKVSSLRDVDLDMLEKFKAKLPGKTYMRALYVLKENKRVQEASNAIKNGDLQKFGNLMYHSHEGLQHHYQVSCQELDFLVDHSREKDFIYGSRMMGGGFGGCTISIIEKDKVEKYVAEVAEAYKKEFTINLSPISVLPSAGTVIQ